MHSKLLSDMLAFALPVAEKISCPLVVYLFLAIGLQLAGKGQIAQLRIPEAPPTA